MKENSVYAILMDKVQQTKNELSIIDYKPSFKYQKGRIKRMRKREPQCLQGEKVEHNGGLLYLCFYKITRWNRH